MFKNIFLLKIYPKASKKHKFTSICSDDHGHGGFVTPFDHCALVITFEECFKGRLKDGGSQYIIKIIAKRLRKLLECQQD